MNRQNAVLLALALMLLTGPGCTSSSVGTAGPYSGGPTDWIASGWRSHVWANRSYEVNVAQTGAERIHNNDYKRGFVAGYQAVCDGGDGEIPAVPPRKYWGSRYLSPEGQAKSRAWFEGYPAGVQAAQADGIDSYRDIYVSQLLDDVHSAQNGYQPQTGQHMNDLDLRAPEALEPVPVVPTDSLDIAPEPSAGKKMPRPLNQAFQSMTSILKRKDS